MLEEEAAQGRTEEGKLVKGTAAREEEVEEGIKEGKLIKTRGIGSWCRERPREG